MSEADRLLHNILEAGDIVGRDAAGRVMIQVAVDRRDFELLMTFGAVPARLAVLAGRGLTPCGSRRDMPIQ